MRKRCIAALIAMGTTISVSALVADDNGAKMMQSAAPAVRAVINNERVTVWDTTSSLPPAAHDFVAIHTELLVRDAASAVITGLK